MLRVQFMGDIDSGMSDESRIRDNVRVYANSDYSTSIPYAINSVMLMGNSLEIDLNSAALLVMKALIFISNSMECLATCSPWMDLNSHILSPVSGMKTTAQKVVQPEME